MDAEGKLLDSANKYVMHYEKGQLPPTNGTWSISQYQGNFVTLYLIYLGVGGEWTGKLFWPAVAVHAVLTILLARTWFNERKAREGNADEKRKTSMVENQNGES